MDEQNLIQGAGGGGKGGGGSSRPAQEAANTLRSRQYARVIDVLCEGEIEGLVGLNQSTALAEQSIYFDGVPLRNELGTPNFNLDAFSWSFVPGTQNQSVIPTGGTVSSEIQVNQEVKAGNTGGGPVIRSIPETYINTCRVTVMVPRLTFQDTTNGDLTGTSVDFAIDVDNNGGGFVNILSPTISGKTNSEYQRSYEFDLPSPGPWNIRVRRLTPDPTTANIQNQLFWSTFTKIVKQPLNYPNTALMGLKVDSALFSKIPARAYKTRLLKVKVPTNYDPIARTYTGLWNGTFKVAWTDNPAWCWYDLATNTRYGLGDYIDASAIDRWTLYSIAQYCDELVPDGFGGQEPRFTCNLLLNTKEEALNVLMNFASIFRGIVYWHSNTIFCSQDRPSNPVKLFTTANVLNGTFDYSGSAKQARHTVAMVSWNDPENQYRQTVEYVEDRESIIRLGIRETEVTAMGCTSRGQANRLGRWILLTEREETDTITFKTGIEGCGIMPGEIIQTTDSVRAGERLGGRIVSATKTSITLDSEVTLDLGKEYSIAVVLPSGAIEEKVVNATGTATNTLTLVGELAEIPQNNAIWILQTESLVPELWRVLSAVETEPNIIEITAIEHVPGKYAAIEQNLKLEPRVTSNLNLKPGAVTGLNAITDLKKLNELEYTTRIFVSWSPPKHAVRYVITWRRDDDNEITQTTTTPTFDIDSEPVGTYTISVAAENAIGLRGPSTTITHVVETGTLEPDVKNLRLNPNFLSQDCPIIWDRLDWAIKYTVQVYDPSNLTTPLREEPVETNAYSYTYSKNLVDGGPRRNLLFKVRAHSWRGASANWSELTASNPAPATPIGIKLEAGPAQVGIFAERPSDPDLEGLIIWMAETSDVPLLAQNIIYKGKDNAYVKTGLKEAKPYYFRLAFYDTFGTTVLNVSSSTSTTTLAAKGIVMVTTLPNSPDDIAGQTAVFLDVEESTGRRGVWGWDGTKWVYTRDGAYLVANSVTADKINTNKLSAISANLGEITSGNITLDAASAIKGGALTFSSGTGFWQGYDTNSYKWRVGSPTSSRAEWNGQAFNIYDSAGNVTISSGIVDWEAISGNNKADDNATRNVFTGDWVSNKQYTVGDIVLNNGNGWSCILGHTSSASNAPPTTGSANTWWTLYAVKGESGASSIMGVLSNEAHSVPADVNGNVTSFAGATTTMTIYSGITDESNNWTYSVTKTNVTCSEVASSRTQTVTAMSADVGYVDITASRTGYANITKRFTISKSKAGTSGAPGTAGPTVTVNPDRAATFTSTDGTFDTSQTNIVFTATVTGIPSPTYAWSFTRQDGSGTTPTASTSSTYTITPANFGSSKSAVVTCTVNSTYTDTFTIVLLQRSTAAAGATKNTIYYQTSAPSVAVDGDIWVDTGSSPVIQYVRSSGAWNASSTIGATFNSGTGQISGQITQSNASTYIANAAIGSAQITDAAITDAKIANAAITTAKIGDAQVDTLKLQGNAVTIPVSASSSGHSSSVTIDCGNIPMTVCVMATTSGSITPPNGVTTHYLVGTLYQNGVAIASTNFTSGSFAYNGMPGFGCCSFNLTFPDLTGLHTFNVRISQAVGSGSWGGGRSGIIALGVKR